jgi:hypothetical protein
MDPYTLACLAGHSDFSTTRHDVHPQAHTVIAAIERAREAQGRHKNGHREEKTENGTTTRTADNYLVEKGMEWSGREDSNLRPGPELGFGSAGAMA